jgi:hypothetical protein
LGEAPRDLSVGTLLEFCRKHRIAVMNAVQAPLDPGIAKAFPDADPSMTVKVSKAPRADHYKKMKGSRELELLLGSLRSRLEAPSLAGCPVHALGNDAEWFIQQALGKEEFARRAGERIPHPSAWWRRGGEFGRIARGKLKTVFGTGI